MTDPFEGHQEPVKSISFSPDGNVIASGGVDVQIRLWNLQGQPVADPFVVFQRSSSDSISALSFSPDGQLIVSGQQDGKIRLWGVQPLRQNEQTRLWLLDDWEALLRMSCDRLRYHPIFNSPTTTEAQLACEVCQKYVWDRK